MHGIGGASVVALVFVAWLLFRKTDRRDDASVSRQAKTPVSTLVAAVGFADAFVIPPATGEIEVPSSSEADMTYRVDLGALTCTCVELPLSNRTRLASC